MKQKTNDYTTYYSPFPKPGPRLIDIKVSVLLQ